MDIKTVGIAGAGTMGNGIAQVTAQAGFNVILCDTNKNQLEKALASVTRGYGKLLEKGKITENEKNAALKRIQCSTSLADFKTADLVIEAINEKFEVKKAFLEQINKIVPDHALYASNTSSISITALASVYKKPEQTVGMHFFNPVPLMHLVEIIPALQSSEATVNTALEFTVKIGKNAYRVKDVAGFCVNRILVPMINEAIWTLYEGIADCKTIDACMKLGANHPMGPLELCDFVGLDVTLNVLEVYQRDLGPERYKPCPLLRKMVEAGRLGRKSGKGFYEY